MDRFQVLILDVVRFLQIELMMEGLSEKAETRRRQLCEHLLALSLETQLPPDRGKIQHLAPIDSACTALPCHASSNQLTCQQFEQITFDGVRQVLSDTLGNAATTRFSTLSDDSGTKDEDIECSEELLPPPPPTPKLSCDVGSTLENALMNRALSLPTDEEDPYESTRKVRLPLEKSVVVKQDIRLHLNEDEESPYESSCCVALSKNSSSSDSLPTDLSIPPPPPITSATATLVAAGSADTCMLTTLDWSPKTEESLELPTKVASASRRFSMLEHSAWSLCGPLSHRGKNLKWQRLSWCMVCGSRLVGHKSLHSTNPSVNLYLAGYRAIYVARDSGASHVIKLVCPAGERENHVLAADTEEQAHSWVQQINLAAVGQSQTFQHNYMANVGVTEEQLTLAAADMQEDSGFSAPISSSSDSSTGDDGNQLISKTNIIPVSINGGVTNNKGNSIGNAIYPTSTLATTFVSQKNTEVYSTHQRSGSSGGLISNVRRKVESFGSSAKRRANRRAVVSCALTAAKDSIMVGVAWVRLFDVAQESWSEVWCQLRSKELTVHHLKNGNLEKRIVLDGLSLALVSDDKKHPGAIRLTNLASKLDVLHFFVADKIQSGSWIKSFIQALGIVPPREYESVVDWIPVEHYKQIMAQRSQSKCDVEEADIYDDVLSFAGGNACDAQLHKRHSMALPPLPNGNDEDDEGSEKSAGIGTPVSLKRSDTVLTSRSDPSDTLCRKSGSGGLCGGATSTLVTNYSSVCDVDSSKRIQYSNTYNDALFLLDDASFADAGTETARTRLLHKTSFELVHEELACLSHEIARLRHKRFVMRRPHTSLSSISTNGDDAAIHLHQLEADLEHKLKLLEQLKSRARRVPFMTRENGEAVDNGCGYTRRRSAESAHSGSTS